jgi:hypothetical protein
MDLQAGTTIVSDLCAVRLTKRNADEGSWIGIHISLIEGPLPRDCVVLDEDLRHYRPVPWEWAPTGDGHEERYRWSVPGYASLVRETRALVRT